MLSELAFWNKYEKFCSLGDGPVRSPLDIEPMALLTAAGRPLLLNISLLAQCVPTYLSPGGEKLFSVQFPQGCLQGVWVGQIRWCS